MSIKNWQSDRLFFAHPDPMWVFSLVSEQILEVNESALTLYGYTREEFMSMKIMDLLPPSDTEKEQIDSPQVGVGRDRNNIRCHLNKAGKALYVDVQTSPLDGEGEQNALMIARDVSNYVLHEDKLRRDLRTGTWRWNLTSEHIGLSREAAVIIGTPHNQAIEVSSMIALVQPSYREKFVDLLNTCEEKGVSFDNTMELRTGSGRQLWVRVLGEAERDEQDRIVSIQGALQEISNFVVMYESGPEDLPPFSIALEKISEAFAMFDSNWCVTYINTRAEDLLQKSRDEVVGTLFWNHFPHALGSNFERKLRDVMHSHESMHTVEYESVLGLWLEISAYSTDQGVSMYLKDVTVEHALNEQLHLLQTAISHLNDVLIITKADPIDEPNGPEIVYVNDAFARVTGYSREEAIGSTPRILQGKKTQRRELDRIKAAMQEGCAVRAELINYKKDGSPIDLEIDLVPLENAKGQLTHFVAVERDVSERKRIDSQLVQAQKMETIGKLTGGIAHDFNNLLTIILGNAEILLEESGANTERRLMAELILSAAQKGSRLVDRLLSFARNKTLESKVVNVNKMILELKELFRRTLRENIEIEYFFASAVWMTELDEGQFEAALMNLIINAQDAMPDGGRLVIGSENVTLDENLDASQLDVPGGQYVRISISDQGRGMDAATLEKAFEPFFTTKCKSENSGLGLSMVYGFANQSEGHARIYSEVGQGTTVHLYFPRVASNFIEPEVSEKKGNSLGGSELILVVEDYDLVRQHLVTQLRSFGYKVLSASNGPNALALIKAHSDIDLLFTDVVMPGGMNGPELVEAAQLLRKDLKVLYTSGYTESAIVYQGRLNPDVELLHKPYRKQVMAEKVRKVLDAPSI